MMNKTKLLIGLVILLATLNISTIATIVYHNLQENEDNETIVFDTEHTMLNGKYFRQTIGFNKAQMEVFRHAHKQFQPLAHEIVFTIDSLKTIMFVELNKPQPDTAMVNNVSNKIGGCHTRLKQATAHFYLTLKATCTPQQSEKLKQAFTPLFLDENNLYGKKHNGQRYQHRRRNQVMNNE